MSNFPWISMDGNKSQVMDKSAIKGDGRYQTSCKALYITHDVVGITCTLVRQPWWIQGRVVALVKRSQLWIGHDLPVQTWCRARKIKQNETLSAIQKIKWEIVCHLFNWIKTLHLSKKCFTCMIIHYLKKKLRVIFWKKLKKYSEETCNTWTETHKTGCVYRVRDRKRHPVQPQIKSNSRIPIQVLNERNWLRNICIETDP